ncbi:MAG: hypothetical protein ACRCU5_07215 [Rhizobiaceae bacterium]
MAIKFLPAMTPSRSAFRIMPASKAIFNPYSNVETIIEEPGDKWVVDLAWKFLKPLELRELRSFLHALRGQAGRCFITDTAHRNLGSWAGTPRVYGPGQYGNILTVSGFTANATVAKAGDRFTVSNRLHELTEDAVTSGTGSVVLRFEPEIINPPAANEPVIHTNPYCAFMLKSPDQIPTFSQAKSGAKDVSISFIEAIR